ncbi:MULTISPECIES: TetR/AcrR family transcriptional regulator [Micrococcaceae]|uniref:TetR/AcrR family transcriptional regulator n=1 Tax=unclassified Kocuria TaxID=2649579 RepID=UPI001012C944|nr:MULTISPECIES: TetR/AcrR family transcriptional regulator [unclassified Kocuria]
MANGRPGRARSEKSRLAILEATRDELVARGYDKFSIDRVSAMAGVGKQTIYRWYPTKSALVAEGILHGNLSPTIPVAHSDDIRRDITAWMSDFAHATANPDNAALLRATTSATAENAAVAAQYEDQVTRKTRAALVSRFQDAIKVGQVREEAPVHAAVEALLGAVLIRVLTRQEVDQAVVNELIDVVFIGLGVVRER